MKNHYNLLAFFIIAFWSILLIRIAILIIIQRKKLAVSYANNRASKGHGRLRSIYEMLAWYYSAGLWL